MTKENQKIIMQILDELGLTYENIDGGPTNSRFRIIPKFRLPQNVYFNIPKNKTFFFQLLSEINNESLFPEFANSLMNHSNKKKYPMGKAITYSTIYLSPTDSRIKINKNIELIKRIICSEIDNMQTILKKNN